MRSGVLSFVTLSIKCQVDTKCCGVSAPEERGPVDGVEGEEDDGEGHPGQPLYVTVPHPAQPSGGAGLHLPCTRA